MVKPSSILKYILGIFLFGLVLWANPIEGYCFTSYGVTKSIPNGTQLPYDYSGFLPSELNTTTPGSFSNYQGYRLSFDNFPFTPDIYHYYSFDYNFNLDIYNTFRGVSCSGFLAYEFYLTYTDSSNVQHSLLVYTCFNNINLDSESSSSVSNISFPVTCFGRPDYMTVFVHTYTPNYSSTSWRFSPGDEYFFDTDLTFSGIIDFANVITINGTDRGSEGSRSSGSISGSGSTSYYSGSISTSTSSSIALTLGPLTGSHGFYVDASLTDNGHNSSLNEVVLDPSGSYFVFGFYALVSDFQIYYDSEINTSLNNIENFSSQINDSANYIEQYTNILTQQFEEFFDYVAPNTQSFNADKSSTDTMIQSASSIQDGYFDSFSSAVNNTGLDSFDWAEYNPQLTYVSTLLTSVYNTFPNKLKYVIYFVLFLGMFSVLINAVGYIVKKGGS